MIDATIHQRYVIREKICSDAVSEDYNAWDEHALSIVTLTLYRPDVAQDQAFKLALQKVSKQLFDLDHPAIRRYLEIHSEPPQVFSISDFVPAVTLQTALDINSKSLNFSQRLKIIRQICSGLEYAHQKAVIHGNLTANDVLVTDAGDVILAHFTPLVYLTPSSPLFLRFISPIYAAPEVLAGSKPTPASDIYNLAVIVYQILANNHLPYDGRRSNATGGSYERLLEEKETLPPYEINLFQPNINQKAWTVLLQALHKDPSQRLDSAQGLYQEIKNAFENIDLSSDPLIELKVDQALITNGTVTLDTSRDQKIRKKMSESVAVSSTKQVKALSLMIKSLLGLSIALALLSFVSFGFFRSDMWQNAFSGQANLTAETDLRPAIPLQTSSTVPQSPPPATPLPNSEKIKLIAFEGRISYSMAERTIELQDAVQEISLDAPFKIEITEGLGAVTYNEQMAMGIYQNSIVEFTLQKSGGSDLPFTMVLKKGKVLLAAQKALIQTSDGTYQAYVEEGLAGVAYYPEEDRFFIHCFEAIHCSLYSLSTGIKSVVSGNTAGYAQGTFLASINDPEQNWSPFLSHDFLKRTISLISAPNITPSLTSPTVTPSTTLLPRYPTFTPTIGQPAQDRDNSSDTDNGGGGNGDSGGGDDGGMPSE